MQCPHYEKKTVLTAIRIKYETIRTIKTIIFFFFAQNYFDFIKIIPTHFEFIFIEMYIDDKFNPVIFIVEHEDSKKLRHDI